MLYSYVQRIYFEGCLLAFWFEVEHLKGNSDNSKKSSKGRKKGEILDLMKVKQQIRPRICAEYMVLNKTRKSATK